MKRSLMKASVPHYSLKETEHTKKSNGVSEINISNSYVLSPTFLQGRRQRTDYMVSRKMRWYFNVCLLPKCSVKLTEQININS